MVTEVLNSLGLSIEESEIYSTLLDKGQLSASEISKNSKVKRTYVYAVCKSLIKKGLIQQLTEKNITKFAPLSPDHLMDLAERQKQDALKASQTLEGILPTLKNKFGTIESKPVITYYEGRAGIAKANLAVLAEKKEILAYLVINKTIDKQMEEFWNKYYSMRISNNIHVRAITPDTSEGIKYKKRDKEELRETKLVPKDEFPLAIEKNIVGNKVVFFSVREGVLIATIIENKEIADTERAIFELAWSKADSYSKKLSN